jgi:hypothetical protein
MDLEQGLDLVPNDPFPAESLEDSLDKLTFMVQQHDEQLGRAIKASRTNVLSGSEFVISAADRANKVFSFDGSGDLAVTQELGTFQGDWATATVYQVRDIVKDTSTNNIFIVNTAHTSSGAQPLTTNANSAKYDLIVDAASATTSATNAAASETAAQTAQTAAEAAQSAAETAQSAAETAETNAETAETNAAASAAAAATSETNAATSATSASGSATTATTKASEASTSATNASTAQTAAETAQTAAETAETNAETAETNAATSETNAATSAATATTQATTATTKASEAAASAAAAATSETNAATSATNAATSETNAANSAAAAATALDNFDDRYLGSKASDPTVDNDGNALVSGALYFNSTANEMRVYDGANWIAASSAGTASLILYEYTATSGQTTFSGADDNSASLSYSVGNIQVVMNGIVLDPSDFTATSGTSVVLASGAATDDLVNIYAFKSFTVADTVSASAGGTFAGDVTFNGAFTSRGIDDNATSTAMTLDSSNNIGIGTSSPMSVALNVHDSTNARIALTNSSTGQTFPDGFELLATGLDAYLQNRSNGNMIFTTNNTERMRLDSSGSVGIGVVPETWNTLKALQINSQASVSADASSIQLGANCYYNSGWKYINGAAATNYYQDNGVHVWRTAASGSADTAISWSEAMRIDSSGRVMIGTTTEGQNQADNLTIADAGNMGMTLRSTDSGETSIFFSDGTSGAAEYAGWLGYIHSYDSMTFGTSGTESMRLTSGGYLALGNTLLPTNGTAGVSLAPEGNVHCGVATTANTNVMRFDNPNGRVGSISTTNSSTSYNTSSDYRLKTDAQPMTGASARVQELNPVNFEWVVDGTRTDGFLAHEAQEVVPEAVTGTKDAMRDEEYEVTPAVYEDVVIPAVLDDEGNELEAERTEQQLVTEAVIGTRSVPDYQGIDQSKLVPLLTAALQEALTKIDAMETRLAALEAE